MVLTGSLLSFTILENICVCVEIVFIYFLTLLNCLADALFCALGVSFCFAGGPLFFLRVCLLLVYYCIENEILFSYFLQGVCHTDAFGNQ